MNEEVIQIIELKIDPEFRNRLWPLTEAEFEQLKENILSDGEVYEPIAVWNGVIVDGHNRWKIIKEHPEIPFKTKSMEFASKYEAFDWMYKKQLGRRNLTAEQKAEIIGKMYESRRMSQGGDRRSENYSKDQNGLLKKPRGGVAEEIGKELGIGQGTVKRAFNFSQGVDLIREESPDAANIILSGKSGLSKDFIESVPKMESSQIKNLVIAIEESPEEAKTVAKKVRAERRKNEEEDDTKQQGKQPSERGEKIAQGRALSKRIAEIDRLMSDSSGRHTYTEEDAEDEFEVIMNEFMSKIRRVIAVRCDVVKGSKRLKSLLYMFSNEVKKLKEEI